MSSRQGGGNCVKGAEGRGTREEVTRLSGLFRMSRKGQGTLCGLKGVGLVVAVVGT